MTVTLTTQEVGALRGMTWGQRWLYVCIRQHMDPATRVAGGPGHPLTWHLLADEMFVEPAPGRKQAGRATREALRRMGEALESAGLIVRHSAARVLIFECPHAPQESCGPNKLHKELNKESAPTAPINNHCETETCEGSRPVLHKELHKEPDILQGKKTRQGESAHARVEQQASECKPLQFGDVFAELRAAGVAIGVATNPRTRQTVAGWVRAGITANHLAIALAEVERAKQHRASQGQFEPVGPMYVDPIVRRVMAGQSPSLSRKSGGGQPQESKQQRDQRRAEQAAELAARFARASEGAA